MLADSQRWDSSWLREAIATPTVVLRTLPNADITAKGQGLHLLGTATVTRPLPPARGSIPFDGQVCYDVIAFHHRAGSVDERAVAVERRIGFSTSACYNQGHEISNDRRRQAVHAP